MSAEQTIGTYVKVHEVLYRIIAMRNTSDLGSKFGKVSFTLVDVSSGPDHGTKYRAYGKRVAWNSRLVPVETPAIVEIPAGMVAVKSFGNGFMTDGCCVGFEPHSRRPLECRFCRKTTDVHGDACEHAYMPAPPVTPTCDHVAGSDGCALDTCEGVPSAMLADRNREEIRPVAYRGECGFISYGRDVANACQARMRDASVTMPTASDNDWTNYDRKGTRHISVYAFTVDGHAVTVTVYDGPRNAISRDAVHIDGFRVIADFDAIRNGGVNGLAYLITTHLDKITVRADADSSLASAVPVGASIEPRHLVDLRPGDVVRSFYDFGGHATVTCAPVRDQYDRCSVATVADGQPKMMRGTCDAVYAVIVPAPAETVQDSTDTPAGTSATTGTAPRGEVTVWAPTREGDGTSRRWTRTIEGVPFGFTAVLMPSGERRYVTVRYNGYGDDGTPEGRESGMRFGCAWSPVHSVTVAAPEVTPSVVQDVTPDSTPDATPAVVQLAPCGCPRETLALVSPNSSTHVPSIGHRADCALHIEMITTPKGATMTPDASPTITPDASQVTPDATTETIPARQYGPLSAVVSVVDLLSALTLAAWSAPKFASVPVLAGVLLTGDGESLTVASYDWERSARTMVPVSGDVSGRSLVNARDFLTLVKGFKIAKAGKGQTLPVGANTVTLTGTGSVLTVIYGSRVATLPTMPAEDFPALPSIPETVATVDAATFAASVKRVTPAASKDDTLPALTMVHCTPDKAGTSLVMTSTDRYRAVWETCAWSQVDDSVSLAPWAHAHVYAPTLAYVASLAAKVGAPITIGYATCESLAIKGKLTVTESVAWSFGPHTVTTVTPDVGFPTIRAIWPNTFEGAITVNAATLASSVKVLNANGDKSCPVVATVAGQALNLSISTGSDGGRDTDTVACTDITLPDGFKLAVNGAYLLDAIRPAGNGDVVLRVTAANKPFVVSVESIPTYECMVMTVRMGGNESNDDNKATPATPVAATSEESTVATHTPAAPVVPVAAVPVPVPATPVTPDKIDVVERIADAARVAMLAGDFPAAFKLIREAKGIAPAGYLVGKGNMTFADIRAMITAAVDASNADMDCEKDLRPVVGVSAPVAIVGPVVIPAPVPVPDVPAPVTVPTVSDVTPAGDGFDPRELLARATWGHGTIGKGHAVTGVDVLTLPFGRLSREQYGAVKAIVQTLGGAWNKAVSGFAFESSRAQFAGGYSRSGREALASFLAAGQPSESVAPVATVSDVTPVPAPVVSVPVVDAPAPVDVRDGVDPADARLMPALTPADASALTVAKAAAVAALVTPAPAGVPVVLADAITFLLAPFATSGVSYRESRTAVRKALLTLGVRAQVAASAGNRRAFTVVCDTADRERVSTLVTVVVALDTIAV